MEEAPQGDRPLEVDECPVKLACGHIFDLHCIYAWLNGDQVREDADPRDTCPLCRVRLYDGFNDDSRLKENLTDHFLSICRHFFDRKYKSRTAPAWLTGSVQEVIDSASQDAAGNLAQPARNWGFVIDQLVHAVTDDNGGFVGPMELCDGKAELFMCLGHELHGHLWLELFLAIRILREALDSNWMRTNEQIDFEMWFVLKAD
ncbi:hypothetical protein P171DRAFT_489890 [Karstenula rhodostoma CBS 690.94]|uniref:RING-type domain-containing protein n=1 Tax=Karstenula rhodostoma CBS 690.94 TaxID=1392251 RepID=A0A9P4PBL2_9PLEO|nr:hypothetical protein P171DRAFT_489890 [Karstenula rhodostoma CBS 690.94]